MNFTIPCIAVSPKQINTRPRSCISMFKELRQSEYPSVLDDCYPYMSVAPCSNCTHVLHYELYQSAMLSRPLSGLEGL